MIQPPAPSEPFTFDEDLHICRDMRGQWIPSVTQILEAQGLSPNWTEIGERIGQDRLDRKSKLGNEVHGLTDVYDEIGDVDPSWLNADNEGYLRSWVGFRSMAGFTTSHQSHRMVATINGMRYTGELDKFGMLHGKFPAILDLKCSEMNPHCWGYQVCAYELAWYNSPRCGRVIRAVVRLKADGSPGQLVEYTNHENDATQFMCALCNVTERIKIGLLKPPEG